jgi:GNAT superfamily N-acetyltransferase
MRLATSKDIPLLVDMMREFYAESGYALDCSHATKAFSVLLVEAPLGCAGVIQAEGQDVGYFVLILCYSMEYGGLIAFVDDLFVRPPFRRIGLGTAALAEMRNLCAERRVRAIHVETSDDNPAAQALYRKGGFEPTNRQLLALRLEKPTHED